VQWQGHWKLRLARDFSVILLDRLNISPYRNLPSIDRGLWGRSSRAVCQKIAQGFGEWSDYHVDDFTCSPGMLRMNGKSSMNGLFCKTKKARV